jgi:hypothetical protein
MTVLFLAVWIVVCLIGFAVMFLAKQPMAGAVIIAVPTFIGMVVKPTFALCMMMLVLPTGAGIGYRQVFSLDRGVGIALAVSFAFNWLITRPRLRFDNKLLWVLILYTSWVFFASLRGPYFALEVRHGFTQVQLLALALIAYWIIQANGEKAFRWALRAFIVGTLGTNAIASITGAAMRAVQDEPEARYAATIGAAVEPNMLAAMTSMAILAAVYLLVRDKNVFWRIVYIAGIAALPVILLRIGSRGAMVAWAFTVLSPLLFVRQILRRPALVALLLVAIVVGSASASLIVRRAGLERRVETRLTDVERARKAMSYRMLPIKKSLEAAVTRPMGTGFYSWFEWAGLRHIPHNDFFYALGIFGIPAALLFALFIILIMLTVRRMPLGAEKLYSRAVLTFLVIMGLSMAQLYLKHFWIFLMMVVASERISSPAAGLSTYENSGESGAPTAAD